MFAGRKFITILNSEARQINPTLLDDQLVRKAAVPDIIVHRRSSNAYDLLIIEAKKSSYGDPREIEFDKTKIKKFTSPEDGNDFNYTLGAFLTFVVGSNPGYHIAWFSNGDEI